jgi:hypothetical protein
MAKEFYARKQNGYPKVYNKLADGTYETNEEGNKVLYPAYSVISRKSGLVRNEMMELPARQMAGELNEKAEERVRQEDIANTERLRQLAREQQRWESLTDEQQQREDDEKALSYQKFSMKHHNVSMLRNVESIASALEAASKDVRGIAENYNARSEEYKYMDVESLVRQVMDVLSFLPQQIREKYLVQESFQVIADRTKALELTEKLGLPRESGYPEVKKASDKEEVAA